MGRAFHIRQTYAAQDGDEGHRAVDLATRIVNLVGGVIISLLALRFMLSLFGANRGNGIADFIYSASHPFVSPFFGLFNYKEQFGVVRFEFETLVAIAFYAIAMVLLVALINMGRRVD
jgi:hypothetical protein